MQPLQAGAKFDASTAYGGALPAYSAAPQFTGMSEADQVIDLVQNIRQKDPAFRKMPTGQQIQYVQTTVLPAVKALPKLGAVEDFQQGLVKPLAVTDYAPPVHPNSAPYQLGNAITQLVGGTVSTVTGAGIGAAAGAPAGGIGAIPGALIGGALGAGTFASAQRPAQVMRERNASFQARNKALEVQDALKGAALDYAVGAIAQKLPGGNSLAGKILKGAAGGAVLSGGSSAADQYLKTGKVDADSVFQNALHGGLLGGVVPAGVHIAPRALRAGLEYQQNLERRTVVRGNRRAQIGGVGRIPDPEVEAALDDIFPGTRKRQYNGEVTDETVPIQPTKPMQEAANKQVEAAVRAKDVDGIDLAIKLHIERGEEAEANSLLTARKNLTQLTPFQEADFLKASKDYRTRLALALQASQNDPMYKAQQAREELIDLVVENKGKLQEDNVTGKELQATITEVEQVMGSIFKDMFKLAARLFRKTVKATKVSVPRKVRASKPKPKEVWNPKPTLRRAGRFNTKKTIPHGEAPGQLDLFGNTEDPRRPGMKLENKVIDEGQHALQARLERKEAIKQERKRQLDAATYKGIKPKQLKLNVREKPPEEADYSTHKLLARAFAEDVDQAKKAAKDPTADMSEDEKATYLFAKARLRDRKWLATQLKLKRYKEPKPLTLEQRKLTSTERALYLNKPKELKLRLKKVSDNPQRAPKRLVEKVRLSKQQRRDLETIDQQQARLQRQAMSIMKDTENKLNPQLKLSLQVKRDASRDFEAALNTLTPEAKARVTAQLKELSRRRAFKALDAKLRAGGAKAPGETLQETYDRLEPLMSDKEKYEYQARISQRAKERYLRRIAPKNKTKARLSRTTLDRLMEAYGHKVMNPDVLDAAMGTAAKAHVIASSDYAELNSLLDKLAQPGITANENRRLEAQLQKFFEDRKHVGLWAKYINLRYTGQLIQVSTQTRNYLDGIGYGALRIGILNNGRALIDKGISGALRTKRTTAIRFTKADYEFLKSKDTTIVDDVKNIGYDLKHGTNTANNLQGKVLGSSGVKRGILPRKIDEPLQRTFLAITNTGDRIVGSVADTQAKLSELAVFRRLEKRYPTDEEWKILKARAENEASHANYTNRGMVADGLNVVQKGLTKLADPLARGAGWIKKDESLELGRLFQPYTTILGNSSTKPLELIPGFGAFGIYANRFYEANVTDVPIQHQKVVSHILMAQGLGLLIGAGGIGGASNFMYQLGYHKVYIQGTDKGDSRPSNDLKKEVGASSNRFNFTAYLRFWGNGAKSFNDLDAKTGDTYLPTQGYNTIDSIMRAGTAPGAEDQKKGVPADPNRHDIGQNLKTAISAWGANNDALSGVNRPIETLTTTRNKDTGEVDWVRGAAKLGLDAVGLKIPLQDSIPSPQRDPSTLGEMALNAFPGTSALVPAKVGVDGEDQMKNPGTPTTFKGPETTSGYLYALQQETHKETHLMQMITKNLEIDKQKVPIEYKDRAKGQRALNRNYFALVEIARSETDLETLPPAQQVDVLSKIKNDVMKSYVAAKFHKPITKPGLVKGESGFKIDFKFDQSQGAKALYHENIEAYQGIIKQYVADETIHAAQDVGTQQVLDSIKQLPKDQQDQIFNGGQ